MKSYKECIENGELFNDSNDKELLLAMPQLKREQILHERFNKVQDYEMKKKRFTSTVSEEETVEIVKPNAEDCKCVMSRDEITPNIFKPFINILKGTFVRTGINNMTVICKIIGFSTTEKYQMNGKPIMTSIAFDLDTGNKVIKCIPVNFISSSKPTSEEIDEFIRKFKILDFTELNMKYNKVISELKRSLTDGEITKMIENKLKDNPKKLTNTEKKIQFIAKRDDAIQRKNKESAMHYQSQLELIEDEERLIRKRKVENDNDSKRRFIK